MVWHVCAVKKKYLHNLFNCQFTKFEFPAKFSSYAVVRLVVHTAHTMYNQFMYNNIVYNLACVQKMIDVSTCIIYTIHTCIYIQHTHTRI